MKVSYMIENSVIYDLEQSSAPLIGELVSLEFYRSERYFVVMQRSWIILRGKAVVTIHLEEVG